MTAFSVVAIIAAYNEEDVIGHVVGDLIEQGVAVYLIDHRSTDRTVQHAEPHLGKGLLHIERFPPDDDSSAAADRFDWERILRRKEALSRELAADWFIHHDADEIRESPWAGVGLAEGIRRVDALGYNAIDFALFNFWPVDDRFRPGDDLRQAFPLCEQAPWYDRDQIRCWKRTDAPVDLTSSGGHEACFPDRKVFPLRFVLRHYPIRSQAHGERKIFRDRRARFVDAERTRGWHIQYDAFTEGTSFLRDASTLVPFDPDAVRLELSLQHRGVEALQRDVDALTNRLAAAETRAAAEAERLRDEIDKRGLEIAALQADLTARTAEVERAGAALEDVTRRLRAVYDSRTWRWSAPLRAIYRALGGH